MNGVAAKQSILLPPLKRHPRPALLRRICAVPDNPQSEKTPSFVDQVVTLLQADNNDWTKNNALRQLVFPASGDFSRTLYPGFLLRISRRLRTSEKAYKFFNYIRTASPSPPDPGSLSAIFQGILELARHEKPNELAKLSEFYSISKNLNVPLTPSAVVNLIRAYGRAGNVKHSLSVYNSIDIDKRNDHIRNEMIDVLLRSGKVNDALHLLDEMLKPDSTSKPNGKTTEIVFGGLLRLKKKEFSTEEIVVLVMKFFALDTFIHGVWLNQIIQGLCRSGKKNQAWDLFHELMKKGKQLNIGVWNSLLNGLSRGGDFRRMNILQKEMHENNVQPDIITFGILINSLCKLCRVDNALEVFKKMTEGENGVRIQPDVVLYNTLIDGLCKVGRQEEGLSLMKNMNSQHKVTPNTVTYNCLIDGFCKSGVIEKAQELFGEMNDLGIPANAVTLNSLVDGMCKNGRVNSALELFNEMQAKGLKGNAVTYTALIRAFCNASNLDKAMKLFAEMSEKDVTPDAIVYYTLISGYCSVGRLDDASNIVSIMKESRFCLDVLSYNMLIGTACRMKRKEKISELLADMEKDGIKPDTVTYNTMISFFGEAGDLVMAQKIMKKMVDDKCVPTIVTYGALINAHCLKGNLNEAMDIYRELSLRSKVRPNTVIYNMLIDAFCKNDKIEDALLLMEDMKKKKVKPNTNTFNTMFKGLRDMNLLDKTLTIMNRMIEENCNPDLTTLEILTEWFSAVGEIEKLKSFIQGHEVSTLTTQSTST